MEARLATLFAAPIVRELHGGHQARVFEIGYDDGRRIIAKVLDARLVDKAEVAARVQVVAELADLEPMVCAPVALHDRLVTELTVDGFDGLLTAYEHADGVAMDTADRMDAVRMGRVLATLHEAMRRLAPVELPLVAALASAGVGDDRDAHQLLHGDFNAGNLRQLGGSIKVFDFDDCGYGPPAFDVANALYMVLFDSLVGQHAGLYERFADGLLEGYAEGCGRSVDASLVTDLIDRRVAALAMWIDDLPNAPTGIRTASPQWHGVLRSFVNGYRAMPRSLP